MRKLLRELFCFHDWMPSPLRYPPHTGLLASTKEFCVKCGKEKGHEYPPWPKPPETYRGHVPPRDLPTTQQQEITMKSFKFEIGASVRATLTLVRMGAAGVVVKAPDARAERWMLKHGESIIERLIASHAPRPIIAPAIVPTMRPTRDRYYRLARRCAARKAAASDPVLRAMRGAR